MDIYEAVNKYVIAGYSKDDAIPKVAQDIVLLKIGNSKYNKNITVKGGVVMHNISKDMRRATRDMDIDFIKYSLEDKSILNFIKELNEALENFNSKNELKGEKMDDILLRFLLLFLLLVFLLKYLILSFQNHLLFHINSY